MYVELIKNCTEHEFKIHNDGCKVLRIMPKGLYGYMNIYYTNIKSLKEQLKKQMSTSYIFFGG